MKMRNCFIDKIYGPYFKFPTYWEKLFIGMSDAEIGSLVVAIIKYAFYEDAEIDESSFSKTQLAAFEIMKRDVDYQYEHRRCYRYQPDKISDRNCLQYREWRKNVYERDDYTCVNCGQRGGKLNAHHIKRFADFPEYRFDLNNGVTLCESCHRLIHRRNSKCQIE